MISDKSRSIIDELLWEFASVNEEQSDKRMEIYDRIMNTINEFDEVANKSDEK